MMISSFSVTTLNREGVCDWLQTPETGVPAKIAIVPVSNAARINAFMRIVLAV
jgi:hypothetical protein